MAFYIKDAEADRLVRTLAASRGVGITEAIRIAAKNELRRTEVEDRDDFFARIKPIQDRIASYPSTGLKADKAFYDSLNDED
jgi:antitoxin VapB